MSFDVRVDVANPGQFFACCGLFELAARMAGHAVAHFDRTHFFVESDCSLATLLECWTNTPLVQVDEDDDTSSRIDLGPPFDLRLDWWKDDRAGGRELKVWAGTMQSVRIAEAMVAAVRASKPDSSDLFDFGCIVYDPRAPTKKVEPFYFDARRAPNAHSRDVGFSPNDLGMTTTAFPAVEALCLVGLQRCRPAPTAQRRVFEYRTWPVPLSLSVVAPVISGAVPVDGTRLYRFENWFRTGQKKHKAFRLAVATQQGE